MQFGNFMKIHPYSMKIIYLHNLRQEPESTGEFLLFRYKVTDYNLHVRGINCKFLGNVQQ